MRKSHGFKISQSIKCIRLLCVNHMLYCCCCLLDGVYVVCLNAAQKCKSLHVPKKSHPWKKEKRKESSFCCKIHCKKCKGGEKDARVRGLIHVVKPVDEIEKGKHGGEYYPWPSIDGVDVCEIWDFDFQLRRASAQSSLFRLRVSLQAVPPWAARLPVLDPWVIQHHRGGVSRIADAGGDLVPGHFIMDLQRSQQDVPLRVHLRGKEQTQHGSEGPAQWSTMKLWIYNTDFLFFFFCANNTQCTSLFK